MGNALSALIAPNEAADENERKKKEQLELMMKLADARLDTFQGELEKMFLDRESAMKTSVPGKRALRFERHVAVDAESTVRNSVSHVLKWTSITYHLMPFSLEKVSKMLLTHSLVLPTLELRASWTDSNPWSRQDSLPSLGMHLRVKATIRNSLYA